MFNKFLSNRLFQISVLLVILSAVVMFRLAEPKAITRLRDITFDYYNKLMPRIPGTGVIIVDIDEESVRRIGQWPWPRTVVGKIPEQLKEWGAKSIGFDMVFAEPDRTSPNLIADNLPDSVRDILKTLPNHDDLFAKKIAELGNVVTGFVVSNQPTTGQPPLKTKFFQTGYKPDAQKFVDTYNYVTVNLPDIAAASAGNGSFTALPEQDGIIRRVPLLIAQQSKDEQTTVLYPALSLEVLRVALGKSIYKLASHGERSEKGYGLQDIKVGKYTIPTDENGHLRVYYSGHKQARYIPAWQVVEGSAPVERIKNSIVLVGTSAIGLLDLRSSPLDVVVPGVEIHAEIVEQILADQFLERPEFFDAIEVVAAVLVSLLIIALSPFLTTLQLASIVSVLIAGAISGSLYLYRVDGLLLDPVYPSLTVLGIFTFSSIFANLRSELERRAVKNAFSHYISGDLMNDLMQDPDKLKLGGEVRNMSVMFTDVRDFTTISESMTPKALIKMMNDFLTPMTELVMDNRGTIDKYMGDAMMAFWNAPLDDADHARHACITALGMRTALEPVNVAQKQQAHDEGRTFHEIKAGIGIATGSCSVGNMGSKQRFAYSALGDTVNLGSRLEGQTKTYGVDIMASNGTYEAVPEFAWVELDLLAVKGRKEAERVRMLVGDETYAARPDFKKFLKNHTEMLTHYRAQDFKEAKKDLTKGRAMMEGQFEFLYDLYLERIKHYAKNPPNKNWGGVWVATSK